MNKKTVLMINSFLGLIFLSVLVIGYLYRTNLMTIELNSVGGHILEQREIAGIPLQKGKVLAGLDKKLLATPTKDFLAKGKKLFDVNCFSCHGLEGKGDGVAAVALNPKPRNFHIAEGWKNGHKVSDIFRTLTHGIVATGMPGFDYMPPGDRLAMAHYVRSFNGHLPKDSPVDLDMLDREFSLTKGTAEPNTIPVEKAEAVIIQEEAPFIKKVNEAVKILAADESPEAKDFKYYVANLKKVMATLYNGDQWEKSKEDFTRFVTSEPFDKGFNEYVLSAGPDELKTLWIFAKKIKK